MTVTGEDLSLRHESHVKFDPDKLLHELHRRGLSAAEFAARAGISAPTLSRIIHGRGAAPATARRIAETLAQVRPVEGLDRLLAR